MFTTLYTKTLKLKIKIKMITHGQEGMTINHSKMMVKKNRLITAKPLMDTIMTITTNLDQMKMMNRINGD